MVVGKTLQQVKWESVAGADEKQVLLEVGADGRSVMLYGIESSEGWQFRAEASGPTLVAQQVAMFELPEQPWVVTWRSALKQLDAYSWTQLHAQKVHPEFRGRVYKALKARQKKGLIIDWGQWGAVLDIYVDQ
jgi:hypothetical protein